MDDAVTVTLDIRPVPPREKHPTIFRTFDALAAGQVMRLVNDHNPRPLFYEFQAERPGQVEWVPQREGPDEWVIDIRKV